MSGHTTPDTHVSSRRSEMLTPDMEELWRYCGCGRALVYVYMDTPSIGLCCCPTYWEWQNKRLSEHCAYAHGWMSYNNNHVWTKYP